MQPSAVDYACFIGSYIGFAHLLRRSVFLRLGGYQESFHFYGEEKDFCLRLLNAGYRVVYLPDARVAHVPDPAGRSRDRYLRYVIRNDCLSALFNEPMLLAMVTVPIRLRRYRAMARHSESVDPDGFRWIVRELVATFPTVWRTRKPVRWASIREWRRLRRAPPVFELAEAQ
jgi:GT2 family glycosyltransferase